MLKNTVTGSFLAKMFPTMSKHFLENASQDEVNKAEQEAAVIHQQLNALGESGTVAAAATSTTGGAAEGVVPTAGVPAPTTNLVVAADNVTPIQTTAGVNVTALTTRATTAEAKVTELTDKLTAAEADRDRYKAWYDKQAGKGSTLPGADATTRGAQDGPQLSPASASALAIFRQRQSAS